MSGNSKKRVHFHRLESVYLLSSSRSKSLLLKEDKHKWVRLTASTDSEKQAEVGTPQELLFLTCLCWICLSELSCFSGGVIFLQVTRLQKPPQIRDRSVINLRWHPDATFYAAFNLETAQKSCVTKIYGILNDGKICLVDAWDICSINLSAISGDSVGLL